MITGYPITVVTVDDMENLLLKFKWTYGIAIAKNHFFCEKETDATLRCTEKIRAKVKQELKFSAKGQRVWLTIVWKLLHKDRTAVH